MRRTRLPLELWLAQWFIVIWAPLAATGCLEYLLISSCISYCTGDSGDVNRLDVISPVQDATYTGSVTCDFVATIAHENEDNLTVYINGASQSWVWAGLPTDCTPSSGSGRMTYEIEAVSAEAGDGATRTVAFDFVATPTFELRNCNASGNCVGVADGGQQGEFLHLQPYLSLDRDLLTSFSVQAGSLPAVTVTEEPFEIVVDPQLAGGASAVLVATVARSVGEPLTIEVGIVIPPVATLSTCVAGNCTPIDPSTPLSGTVELDAEALDGAGELSVEFFIDGTAIGSTTLDTDQYAAGQHALRAVITQGDGDQLSANVTATFD